MQPSALLPHLGLHSARRDVDGARLQRLAVDRFLHVVRREPVHAIGEEARERRRHVLRDDERHRQQRQRLKEMLQRGRPAGRAADRDELDPLGARLRRGIGRRAASRSSSCTRRRRLSIRTFGDLQHFRDEIALDLLERGETRPPGLAMKSSAPSSSALKTLRSLARDETTITAVGRFAISQRRNAKPSMIGISRSSVITSGRCFIACLIPSSPLTAVRDDLDLRSRLQHPRDRHAVVRGVVDDEGAARGDTS